MARTWVFKTKPNYSWLALQIWDWNLTWALKLYLWFTYPFSFPGRPILMLCHAPWRLIATHRAHRCDTQLKHIVTCVKCYETVAVRFKQQTYLVRCTKKIIMFWVKIRLLHNVKASCEWYQCATTNVNYVNVTLKQHWSLVSRGTQTAASWVKVQFCLTVSAYFYLLFKLHQHSQHKVLSQLADNEVSWKPHAFHNDTKGCL